MQLGKWLVILGIGLTIVGLLIWLGSRMGLPFGKLPGDLHLKKDHFSLRFPLVSSLIISLILTLILNLIIWFFRK
jgi:Na+-driven multidrug efflux pump